MSIILASQSPRRQALLKYIIKDFSVATATIDEVVLNTDLPEVSAMSLAFQKAYSVSTKTEENTLVIGADTIVYLERCLGKPKDEKDAADMLRHLSGKVHHVITGVAIIDSHSNKKQVFFNKTQVSMRILTEREIKAYIKTGEPMDKAGAYGIQGIGARFIKEIQGDFYAVMGLPICQLDACLKTHFQAHYSVI